MAQGKSNREIADALVLGERTIETHVGNVLSKLGFTSRCPDSRLGSDPTGMTNYELRITFRVLSCVMR